MADALQSSEQQTGPTFIMDQWLTLIAAKDQRPSDQDSIGRFCSNRLPHSSPSSSPHHGPAIIIINLSAATLQIQIAATE
ncbi:hypothetical protein ACLOJK_014749, partial [Asimina triloba]